MSDRILVAGAGGYVGGKLVKYLAEQGHDVVAVSSRPVEDWLYTSPKVKSVVLDLRSQKGAEIAVQTADWVYNLAAKVGGIGYIQGNKADCLLSSLINTNLLCAAKGRVKGYFFASSACVYGSSEVPAKENDTLSPSAGYGQEKAFSEVMCQAFAEDYGLPVRIGRYHTVYGPGDNIKGRENKDHVPAALCRKVIQAKFSGVHEIAIWGDGEQTRDFLFIDDCVLGSTKLMNCGTRDASPTNIGSSEVASINQLVTMLEEISGVKLTRFYSPDSPVGVKHRGCDNTRLKELTGWEPTTRLRVGMERLYRDLWDQAMKQP